MSLINLFTETYGEEACVKVLNYMIDNDIFNEFNKIKENYSDLFYFGIKYGIFEIVKFLYEKVGLEYDYSMIQSFNTVIDSKNNPVLFTAPINAVTLTTGSTNTKMNVEVQDKFSNYRNLCINYLIDMKKYSHVRSSNKKFYYKFNKKYVKLLTQ